MRGLLLRRGGRGDIGRGVVVVFGVVDLVVGGTSGVVRLVKIDAGLIHDVRAAGLHCLHHLNHETFQSAAERILSVLLHLLDIVRGHRELVLRRLEWLGVLMQVRHDRLDGVAVALVAFQLISILREHRRKTVDHSLGLLDGVLGVRQRLVRVSTSDARERSLGHTFGGLSTLPGGAGDSLSVSRAVSGLDGLERRLHRGLLGTESTVHSVVSTLSGTRCVLRENASGGGIVLRDSSGVGAIRRFMLERGYGVIGLTEVRLERCLCVVASVANGLGHGERILEIVLDGSNSVVSEEDVVGAASIVGVVGTVVVVLVCLVQQLLHVVRILLHLALNLLHVLGAVLCIRLHVLRVLECTGGIALHLGGLLKGLLGSLGRVVHLGELTVNLIRGAGHVIDVALGLIAEVPDLAGISADPLESVLGPGSGERSLRGGLLVLRGVRVLTRLNLGVVRASVLVVRVVAGGNDILAGPGHLLCVRRGRSGLLRVIATEIGLNFALERVELLVF
mmetsp:Transcript_63932/g.151215  ORF Transcript_63932/g.151215 Transcript_63932/m.151215 type:complete len:506 (+) Transcript_63932:1204-2721(+)